MKKAILSIVAVLASVCGALTGAAVDFSGEWVGTWSSIDTSSGWGQMDLSQSGNTLTGTFDVESEYDGYFYDVPCTGTISGNTASFTMTAVVDGYTYKFKYTHAQLDTGGTTMSGNYTITENGAAWDTGTFFLNKTIQNPKLTVTGGLIDGADASASVPPGEERTVTANEPVVGKVFTKWTVSPATANLGEGFDANSASTTVVMPAVNVTLTAVYVAIPKLTVTGGAYRWRVHRGYHDAW